MTNTELLALAERLQLVADLPVWDIAAIRESAAILRKFAALEPAAYEIENDAGRNWFDCVPYSGVASLPLYNLTGIIDHEA